MSRSPIEKMIDEARGIKESDWIILRCPDCGKEMSVLKEEGDPPTATVALIPCRQCWNDDSKVKYLYGK